MKKYLTSAGYAAALTVNNLLDYDVSSNETWTTDRYFKGNITVRQNKTLIIKCSVAMTKGAKIIVEVGGQLIIDGGVITNISDVLWEGIFVKGNPFQSQVAVNPNSSGALLYQGIARIKNGGTITHASIGIRNHLTSIGATAIGSTGGVIFAQNANFIDNVKDVYMLVPASGAQPSNSWFYNCNFKTQGVISGNYTPINHIELRNVNGIKFMGCYFLSGASPNNGGNGIYSVDAIYTVDKSGYTPCVFENLVKGIYINNINPLKTPLISNSMFSNNYYGAYVMNANYLAFQSNTLTCSTRSGASEVYLNNCKYYKIKNNKFSHSSNYAASEEGVTVYKSQSGAHEIFRNEFSNMYVGVNCMDNNGNANSSSDGLKINCNDFHINPNSYDVVLSFSTGLSIPTVNRTQGQAIGTPPPTSLVRNIYGANCGNQNKWQIYSGATAIINHGSNTNTLAAVTQPTATGCKSQYLNVQNMNQSLDYGVHCPLSPPSSGGSSTVQAARLTNMNDYIGTLSSQRAAAVANGDVPDDFELQSTISSKLNLYITDSTIVNQDSVISILENNIGYMEDADIQTVYAYISKGDFVTAQAKVNEMGTNRADWKALLTQIISILPDTLNGLDNISGSYVAYFTQYSSNISNDGSAAALAVLKAANVAEYNEPHAQPEGATTARIAKQKTVNSDIQEISTDTKISVFPNPTKSALNLYYASETDGIVQVEISDLLGKVIYANFITGKLVAQNISLAEYQSGMYILSITKDKEVVYKTKIIKED